jgi:hypothetical protein
MVDNGTRFGALCSANKTDFVFLHEQMQVRVTGAWFTGHRSFMRAWACFIRLADSFEGTPIEGLPRGWLPPTPLQSVAPVSVESGSSNDDDDPGVPLTTIQEVLL